PGHCGIQSAGGVHEACVDGRRRGTGRMWISLRDIYMSFNVVHSGLYRRKGHGNGEKIDFAFWAVRARRDATGIEIGL
ncbi:hypothetical protein C8R44DRAFT_584530, partial [Mycena epipterygia]